MSYLFTSESVALGHPDKLCDFVADSILDEILSKDKNAHTGIEVTACPNFLHIMGEVFTTAKVDYVKIARDAIKKIGYTDLNSAFNYKVEVRCDIHEQSVEINSAVSHSDGDIGAGDQGIMFGYATDETPLLMPYPIYVAHNIIKKHREVFESSKGEILRPDAKCQITVSYNDKDDVDYIDTLLLSCQHKEGVSIKELTNYLNEKIIKPTVDAKMINKNTKILVNPSGSFVLGGPVADTGLTGRKLVCDTYGGAAHHGGGAFAGKDPSKVDRSAALMMHYIARSAVKAGVCKKCELQVSYAIGVAKPISLFCNTFGTMNKNLRLSDEDLAKFICDNFDLTPKAIINNLALTSQKYAQTHNPSPFALDAKLAPWQGDNAKVFESKLF